MSASCCGGVALHNSPNNIDHRLSLKSLRYFHLGFISPVWVILPVSPIKNRSNYLSEEPSCSSQCSFIATPRKNQREVAAHPFSAELTLQLELLSLAWMPSFFILLDLQNQYEILFLPGLQLKSFSF